MTWLDLDYDVLLQQPVVDSIKNSNMQLDEKRGFRTGGIKGYEQLFNNMRLFVDYGHLVKSWLQYSQDFVCFSATFDSHDDMCKAFDDEVFGGKYSKFKNGC